VSSPSACTLGLFAFHHFFPLFPSLRLFSPFFLLRDSFALNGQEGFTCVLHFFVRLARCSLPHLFCSFYPVFFPDRGGGNVCTVVILGNAPLLCTTVFYCLVVPPVPKLSVCLCPPPSGSGPVMLCLLFLVFFLFPPCGPSMLDRASAVEICTLWVPPFGCFFNFSSSFVWCFRSRAVGCRCPSPSYSTLTTVFLFLFWGVTVCCTVCRFSKFTGPRLCCLGTPFQGRWENHAYSG